MATHVLRAVALAAAVLLALAVAASLSRFRQRICRCTARARAGVGASASGGRILAQLYRGLRWGVPVRLLVRAALALSLVLLDTQARASGLVLEEAWPTAVSPAMGSQSMPAAFDCAPCARCYVAPAPATHGFNGDDHPPEKRWRHVQQPLVPSAISIDTGARLVALPVRIGLCRWLN